MEMVTNMKSDHRDLMRTHVWGCPAYVLEAKLQDGKKLPKWNRRARMGQFLGFSKKHSSTIALVRNLHTCHVSPQYHVVFDDKFETVFHDGKTTEELDKICDGLFAECRDCYAEDEYDDDGMLIYMPPPLDEVWLSEPERRERRDKLEKQRTRAIRLRDVETREVKRHTKEKVERLPDLEESDVDSDDDVSLSSVPDFDPGGDDRQDYWSQNKILPEKSEAPAADPLPVLPHPPPSPIIAPPDSPPSPQAPEEARKHADEMMYAAEVEVPSVEALMACPISKFIHFAANECGYSGTRYDLIANWVHPLFLKAKCEATKADNPNWRQAMNGPFKEEYWKAALKEIETLEAMDAWEVVDPDDSTMNVIDSIWAFRLKRFPDGKAKKFKARFCARGDQQLEGIDFFETYAPVVQWTTVRLMLILEVLLELKSKQGDVTCAFLHSELDQEKEKVYVEMPLGFRQKGKVLKLKKTLYELRQSPRAFWQFLTKAMTNVGMTVSKSDPCLFVSERVVARRGLHHRTWSETLQEGLLLEEEDDAAGYLGVDMTKTPEGYLEMKQTGLLDRILEALGLDSKLATSKWTPAEAKPLTRDLDGEGPHGSFSYSSVVGMMLYLAGHLRPDIAYSVNCCARYMFSPRLSCEKALKRIGRYLKATRDKGLILKPCHGLQIDAFLDADFAGLYGYAKITDSKCVKSRTGFLIEVSECPVVWVSKLQSETAMSTMEAETIALSHCCRELFPVIDVVTELGNVLSLDTKDLASMHVSIHEDNAGALVLAETIPPEFTPRSKYYAIKTVWFREEIQKCCIKLHKIDTVDRLGDIFTKGLTRATFEYLRGKIMGW
eukprot:scaffold249367_cov117-Cyclotella_meneghiniana.AAC.2